MLLSLVISAQKITLHGNMAPSDSLSKTGLANALFMLLKFNDSSLVTYTRSNQNGFFYPIKCLADTYLVIISHPKFSDKTFLLVCNQKDTAYNFKNIILPPKTQQLKEVEVFARKEKMYYKGDTLQFTADSFKVQTNANVEDLLKKLPGVKVDGKGKITMQGKEVTQVLVDGDEFFGTDPTVATKNLNANAIETIQVYDKKNEETDKGDETVKVMNLKLKEDAKKGYFGKADAASDFQKFYEGSLMFNKFKNKQKMSLFATTANTPKQAVGYGDAQSYGLSNEQANYDFESNTFSGPSRQGTGIPQSIKAGTYFNDNLSKKTKINIDYTYAQSTLKTFQQTNTKYFLTDTSYNNTDSTFSSTTNQTHTANLKLTHKFDSLTELIIKPNVKYSLNKSSNLQLDQFTSSTNVLTRATSINNLGNSNSLTFGGQIKLTRNFKKKDRLLVFNYTPSYQNSINTNSLNTGFNYYLSQKPDCTLIQHRNQLGNSISNAIAIDYNEPITKKIKLNFNYSISQDNSHNQRTTNDFNGTNFDFTNPNQSNNFKNFRTTNSAGSKIIYEVKKYKISLGATFRNIYQRNQNLTLNSDLNNSFSNILPNASFNYRINQGSNFFSNYYATFSPPSVQQLQPVVDNSNPNSLTVGNPALKPSYNNNLNINYYFYKGISDVNMYAGGYLYQSNNQIVYKSSFDNFGRIISTPVNVNGAFNANVWSGGGFPILKKFLKVDASFSGSYSKNLSYINNALNTSENYGLGPNLGLNKYITNFEFSINGEYDYNIPKQTITLQTLKPYYTWGLSGDVMLKLPKKIKIKADANYKNNGNRAAGYNLTYFIVNASLSKSFFSDESLTVSVEGNDILNQNISNSRTIGTNTIVDTKTQIIKQYFLLRLVYKVNSKKTKSTENQDGEFD